MGIIRVKPGVQFTTIAPGGFRILRALDQFAAARTFDLTITSACDGTHSGPFDPHHRGEAYDVRTRDLDQDDKNRLVAELSTHLGARFYAFLEAPNTPNEHVHIQVRKGTVYP